MPVPFAIPAIITIAGLFLKITERFQEGSASLKTIFERGTAIITSLTVARTSFITQEIANHELLVAYNYLNTMTDSSQPKRIVQAAADHMESARLALMQLAPQQSGESAIAFWESMTKMTFLLSQMNLYIHDFGYARKYLVEVEKSYFLWLRQSVQSVHQHQAYQVVINLEANWLPIFGEASKFISAQENAVQTCEIVYRVSGFWETANYFWAKGTGPNGDIQIERSDITFWNTPMQDYPQDAAAFKNLVDKLRATGWVDSGKRGGHWYSYIFEKKLYS